MIGILNYFTFILTLNVISIFDYLEILRCELKFERQRNLDENFVPSMKFWMARYQNLLFIHLLVSTQNLVLLSQNAQLL